jgi:hypothetical protein
VLRESLDITERYSISEVEVEDGGLLDIKTDVSLRLDRLNVDLTVEHWGDDNDAHAGVHLEINITVFEPLVHVRVRAPHCHHVKVVDETLNLTRDLLAANHKC